jgi:hypothetical protein
MENKVAINLVMTGSCWPRVISSIQKQKGNGKWSSNKPGHDGQLLTARQVIDEQSQILDLNEIQRHLAIGCTGAGAGWVQERPIAARARARSRWEKDAMSEH